MLDVSRCESPLEVRLARALERYFGDELVDPTTTGLPNVVADIDGWGGHFAIQPSLGWCRPDFMLFATARNVDAWRDAADLLRTVVVIEVDGHDYHERTKEQARRDRARDRAMLWRGWLPLRFTGQEVWQDATACAAAAGELWYAHQCAYIAELERLAIGGPRD